MTTSAWCSLLLIAFSRSARAQASAAPAAQAPAAQSQSAPSRLTALTVYDGRWQVDVARAPDAADSPAKADHLVNHCHLTDAFYTCEQVVNGKPVALLVFAATERAGVYRSVVVLPDGSAGHASQVTIAGNHWTYLSSDEAGKPVFRVENYFRDRDHIHYEQYKADSSGAWTKMGAGDEVRER